MRKRKGENPQHKSNGLARATMVIDLLSSTIRIFFSLIYYPDKRAIVAVAITVSVAVAYWMGGISSQYTQFEKVEIQTAYAVKTSGIGWNITMEIKNTGSAASTLLRCFINEEPIPTGNYNATTFPGSSARARRPW